MKHLLFINFGPFLDEAERSSIRSLTEKKIVIIEVDSTVDYHSSGTRLTATEQGQAIIDQVTAMLGDVQPDLIMLPPADGIMAMKIKRTFPDAKIVVMYDGLATAP